jgi:acyl-CoA thioesterase
MDSSKLRRLRLQLTAVMNSDRYFSAANGITITAIRDGYAEGSFPVTLSALDVSGAVHKGALSTLMDSVAAAAAAGSGWNCVTLNCETHFLEPVFPPAQLIGEAHLISTSGRICAYRTAVRQDSRLVATGTYTFYLTGEL